MTLIITLFLIADALAGLTVGKLKAKRAGLIVGKPKAKRAGLTVGKPKAKKSRFDCWETEGQKEPV